MTFDSDHPTWTRIKSILHLYDRLIIHWILWKMQPSTPNTLLAFYKVSHTSVSNLVSCSSSFGSVSSETGNSVKRRSLRSAIAPSSSLMLTSSARAASGRNLAGRDRQSVTTVCCSATHFCNNARCRSPSSSSLTVDVNPEIRFWIWK